MLHIKVFYELKVWKNEFSLGWFRLQVPVENLNSCLLTHALVKHKLHWTQLYINLLIGTCTLSKQNFVSKSSAKSGVFYLKSFLEAVLALETMIIWWKIMPPCCGGISSQWENTANKILKPLIRTSTNCA